MEMFGLLGAGLGAAGSIGSAVIGANAQHEASVNNYMVALMNYYQRQREVQQAQMEASRIENKNNQGFTDARGNSTKYVPGQGWVATAAPDVKALQSRETNEQMQALGTDATIKRQQLLKNSQRSSGEGDYANALMDQMRRQLRTNPDQLENTLRGAATQGVNRAYDDTQAGVNQEALRTRSSNAGEAMKTLARSRSSSLGDAMMSARMASLDKAPAMDAANKGSEANLYNMFASRASAMPDVAFQPSGVSDSASSMLGPAGKLAQTGQGYSFQAASMPGPRMPYMPADYGTANAIGATGSSLGGVFTNLNNQNNYDGLLNAIRGNVRQNQGSYAG